MELFKETADIVKLGKWAYLRIPAGTRCGECPILSKEGPDGFGHTHWHCELRRAMGLIHDAEGPFKDSACPRRTEVV